MKFFITENSVYLITDYISGPSLEEVIKKNPKFFTNKKICRLMK